MRKCLRCNAEMTEGLSFKVDGGGYGVVVSVDKKLFAKRIGSPKVAVCKNCGYTEIYMDEKDLLNLRDNF